MKIPTNQFKRKLARNDTTYGLWLGLRDTIAVEICAGAGFDWLLLDAEHAPMESPDLLAALQTMASYSAAPIVRPLDDNPSRLKRLLDIGVQTLLIPMVHTRDQAIRVVAATRYPPEGTRGLGTSLARAARWNRVNGYIETAADELCIIPQIESLTGLKNLERIAETDGVDALFVGPSDLGAAIGLPGQSNAPEVIDAVAEAIQRIVATGKPAGVLATTQLQRTLYLEAGATFLGVGTDTAILASQSAALAKASRNHRMKDELESSY